MAKIKRALISVSAKDGIVEFAKALTGFGVEIFSTGGTATLLRDAGLAVIEVADYTGFPEMLDGRLKTLHPKIHGGILGMRSNQAHVAKMLEYGIEEIDMVVVNLYPFEATVAKPGCTFQDAIENIDIGGPTMVRAAGKNNADVTILTDQRDYDGIISEMFAFKGCVTRETNLRLMVAAYRMTSAYDKAIADYFEDFLDTEPPI